MQGLASSLWLIDSACSSSLARTPQLSRKIQQEEAFPLEGREAAQRLLTTVTQQDQAPMTTDPVGDARLILMHLIVL